MASKFHKTAAAILVVLHLSAFIAGVAYLNWHYCHQSEKGPCGKESEELTSAEKKKCEKLASGMFS